MEAGALGVGSSLIYAPAFYADTNELTELCKVAARYHGKYISHLRSEGNRLLEAVDELIAIARGANIPAEIYHLKAAGEANWRKMDAVIARVERARAQGLKITADMYTYTAGSTGLDACDAALGARRRLRGRLQTAPRDPEQRQRIRAAISTTRQRLGEPLPRRRLRRARAAGRVQSERLKPLTGKTLAAAARLRRRRPRGRDLDLVVEDQSRVGAVYFIISEENIQKRDPAALGLVRLGRRIDGARASFPRSATHPRAYGNFAHVLGKYVRDDRVLTLEDAVRKLRAACRRRTSSSTTAAS